MSGNLEETRTTKSEEDKIPENPSQEIFAVIGIFLVMLLIFFTIKGKLRDWFMK